MLLPCPLFDPDGNLVASALPSVVAYLTAEGNRHVPL